MLSIAVMMFGPVSVTDDNYSRAGGEDRPLDGLLTPARHAAAFIDQASRPRRSAAATASVRLAAPIAAKRVSSSEVDLMRAHAEAGGHARRRLSARQQLERLPLIAA